MFVGLGASGVVPMIQGLQAYGFEAMDERMSLSLVTLQGLIYIFGAFLYAVCLPSFPSSHPYPCSICSLSCSAPVQTNAIQVRWPERALPGKFDIWGSSHQLFHFCVVVAAGTHLYAMSRAFDHHHTIMGSQCP